METDVLRQRILDLAIKGKLVPQDPNDESSSVLLERIRSEKLQMIKDSVLTVKDAKNDTVIFKAEDSLYYERMQSGEVKCIDDEIPFDVPDGWAWTRLETLGQYRKGPFGSTITKSMFISDGPDSIKVYEQKNAINKDASLGTYFISNEKFQQLKSFEVHPNDIIVSCAGTIGETYVLPDNIRKGIINQALMKITLCDLDILEFFLVYFDSVLKTSARSQGYGVALKNIPPFDVLKKYLIPLPPLEEQRRIVRKIDELFDQVKEIEIEKTNLDISISKAKSKILDLAVCGKLVSQDSNDEPASVLLERIRAEKLQMVKDGKLKAKDIKGDTIILKGEDNLYYEKFQDGTVKCIEDETPFELPEGWVWCRLRDIFNVCSSKRVLQSEWKTEGIPFYRAREIAKLATDDYVKNSLYISKEHYDKLKQTYGIPKAGDLMVTGVGTIGKVYIVKDKDCFYYKDASVLCLSNCYQAVDPKFAKLMIDSSLLQKQIHGKTYGNTVDTITITIANNYLCVLPPLSEQIRIVNEVKKAFMYLERIESDS